VKTIITLIRGIPVELHLRCPSEKAISILKSHLVTSFWDKVFASEPQFRGLFFKKRFRITYVKALRDACNPILWGHFVDTDMGCTLYGTIRFSKKNLLLYIFWNVIIFKIHTAILFFNLVFLSIFVLHFKFEKYNPQNIIDFLSTTLQKDVCEVVP
jgi:hypothetical protein